MKYIIMCGGNYLSWQTPRQLLKIQGEPIVARTIRLLRSAGVDEIAISTHDERFARFGVPILGHQNEYIEHGAGNCTGCWVNAFYPTAEPACYLMGDVVFSPAAIKTIVETQTNDVEFLASSPPFAPEYIKPYAEPFAFKVVNQRRFRGAIDFVLANINTGIFCRPPIAWELWQVLNNEPVNDINFHNYIAVNDYTCDIDSPADARTIEEVVRGAGYDTCLS